MPAPLQLRHQARLKIKLKSTEDDGSSLEEVSKLSMAYFWCINVYKKSVGRAIDEGNYYSRWAGSIKEIESLYGTGVGTYFHFLRFLLILNSITFFFT